MATIQGMDNKVMFDFDEIITRDGTNSVSYEGWKEGKYHSVPDVEFVYPKNQVIRMWIADMEFATAQPILDAIRARLDQRILGYSLIYSPAYYEALTDWFDLRYGWTINSSDLVTAPGIVPALNRIIPILTNKDEQILFCTPSYAPFQRAGEINERGVLTSSLWKDGDRFRMDISDLEIKISDPTNKIKVFILCNPHNPTGRVWTQEELTALAQLCLKHDVWIISDEVHCDLLRVGEKHTPLMSLFPEEHRIISCISPSKSFNLAGNMLAHLVIKDPSVRRKWLQHHSEVVSPLSIAAVQAAYADGGPWLDAMRVYLDSNFLTLQKLLTQKLPLAGFVIPEATYLAWIDLSKYRHKLPEGVDFGRLLLTKAGVLVEDGSGFVNEGEGYIRLNIACPRALLETAIDRIAQVLEAA